MSVRRPITIGVTAEDPNVVCIWTLSTLRWRRAVPEWLKIEDVVTASDRFSNAIHSVAGARSVTLLYKKLYYRTDTVKTQCPAVAPPGFCNRGEVRYGSIGGLEYEVPQSRLYCLCINVALCSTALQCFCRVIRRSSTTMKAHTHIT